MKIINMYKCQICGNIIEETSNTDEHGSLWGYVNYKSTHRLPESDRLCVSEDRNHVGLAYYIGSKEVKDDKETPNYKELHRALTLEEHRKYLCINLFNDSEFFAEDGKLLDSEKRYSILSHNASMILSCFREEKPIAFGLFNKDLYGLDINRITDMIKKFSETFNHEVIICDDFRIISEE